VIYIVGIGPGDKKYLTLKSIEIVNNADIIVGSKRALNLFQTIGKKYDESKTNEVGFKQRSQQFHTLTKNLKSELYELLQKNKDKNIVVLSTGDPCFSGLLKTILSYEFISKDDLEVISGISSIQIAAAKLKISWEDYHILTLHGKENNRKLLLELIKNGEKVIFLPGDLKEDIEFLIKNGIDPERKITVCENLTYENERIIYDSLKNILLYDEFSYLCVCIMGCNEYML
jgi:cobalt-precorrin-7 (C5)-methyltransferase